MIGMNKDDLMDTTKCEIFRIIMDVLTRKFLHNRPAIDVREALQNGSKALLFDKMLGTCFQKMIVSLPQQLIMSLAFVVISMMFVPQSTPPFFPLYFHG